MNLEDNDFVLFGLSERFALDRGELDGRWRALQAQVHPDRFVDRGAAAQRVSMQWAVRVNEAYQRLKDPVRRAAYLCGLRGHPVEAQPRRLPAQLLQQQMQWREALDEARDAGEVARLMSEASDFKARTLADLRVSLDERQDAAAAAAQVQALMFVERFMQEVNKRADAMES